jgi:hypothetical protein
MARFRVLDLDGHKAGAPLRCIVSDECVKGRSISRKGGYASPRGVLEQNGRHSPSV